MGDVELRWFTRVFVVEEVKASHTCTGYDWYGDLSVNDWAISSTVGAFGVVALEKVVCVCVSEGGGGLYVRSPLRGASGILGMSLNSCFARSRSCCIVGLVLLYE